MYDAAVQLVSETRRCSTSWLQRKLQLGYNRAARIVESMEKRGLLGPRRRPRALSAIATSISQAPSDRRRRSASGVSAFLRSASCEPTGALAARCRIGRPGGACFSRPTTDGAPKERSSTSNHSSRWPAFTENSRASSFFGGGSKPREPHASASLPDRTRMTTPFFEPATLEPTFFRYATSNLTGIARSLLRTHRTSARSRCRQRSLPT